MQFRHFGKEAVSEVGLGTWQPGGDWGAVGDKEAAKILVSTSSSRRPKILTGNHL